MKGFAFDFIFLNAFLITSLFNQKGVFDCLEQQWDLPQCNLDLFLNPLPLILPAQICLQSVTHKACCQWCGRNSVRSVPEYISGPIPVRQESKFPPTGHQLGTSHRYFKCWRGTNPGWYGPSPSHSTETHMAILLDHPQGWTCSRSCG